MNICEIFIRRPVMTTLLMIGLFFFGIFGYRALPISSLPDVDFPTIVISASLPGASPETMASSVATPLEEQCSTIAGITSMTSSNSLGKSQITLQFDLSRDMDGAAADVQAATSAASKQLPSTLPNPPTYKKVNPADAPILYIALSSSTLPLSTVDYYGESLLAQRISMLSGVAQVNVYGSQKYAVRVQVDPAKLASDNLSFGDIKTAVSNGNVNLPTGSLLGDKQSVFLEANGQLTDASAYRPLVVAYRNGAAIRVQDLGNVIDSVENNQVASWYNNTRAVVLAVQRQPGSNTIAVTDKIKAILPSFKQQLPGDIHLSIIYDRSPSLKDSINEVERTLLIACILVVLVIFAFLRNPSATIIPSIALPLSIIGTFAVMYYLNFSLNLISLMALTLTVGFVVDDAIVMLENIARHLEHGATPFEAALKGSKEIGFTILSMTLSLVAVFIPLLFMGGLIGRLFHEFAVTTSVVILLSGLVSITLTPMLCSRFLKPTMITNHQAWYYAGEKWFELLKKAYERGLHVVLAKRRATLFVFFATLIGSVIFFIVIPKGFIPSQDTGQLMAFTQANPGIGFATMAEKQHEIAQIVAANPNVEGVMSNVGSGASGTTNSGRLFIRLKPWAERSQHADEIANDLRKKLANTLGINAYIQNVQSIQVGGRVSKSVYEYTLQDGDVKELQRWAGIFQDQFTRLPALTDVSNDMQTMSPAINVQIHRNRASSLGVSANDVQTMLMNAFSTEEISTIYAPVTTYKVIMEVLPSLQQNPDVLSQLYIRSSNNSLVPLSAVSSISQSSEPLTINHQGQLPSATISYNLKPGYALSDAVKEITEIKNRLHPPITLTTSFQGTAQAFQDSQKGMFILLIISIVVIYIILGILYENFIHPLTILSGLPSAAIGALFALFLFNMQLDLYSFIGIIMLVGIVKKNAIMMIDFAIAAQREENKSPEEAILQACLVRFRPIMMTTIAAILGVLPLALAFGQAASTLRPLGVAVVGGLLVSQFLTLFITPVIYLYLERFNKKA